MLSSGFIDVAPGGTTHIEYGIQDASWEGNNWGEYILYELDHIEDCYSDVHFELKLTKVHQRDGLAIGPNEVEQQDDGPVAMIQDDLQDTYLKIDAADEHLATWTTESSTPIKDFTYELLFKHV